MIYSIHLEAESTPAMLEQILQTTRVRGFRVRSMEVRNHLDTGRFQVSLTVESLREEARLTSQLEKIPGVYDYRVRNRGGSWSYGWTSGDCEGGWPDGWPPRPPHPFNK